MKPSACGVAALLIAVIGCQDATAPLDPGGASYSVAYDPARSVGFVSCPRYLSYTILSLGSRTRTFGLSINFMDDCTAAGAGWDYWETYIEGTYSTSDTLLTLTPNAPPLPLIHGSFDRQSIRITLPAQRDSMAPVPVAVELGPRIPF